MAETHIPAEVTTYATFVFPVGSTQENGNVVVLPDGSKLKFWVAVEEICDKDGDETYLELSTAAMQARGIQLEYNKSAELLGDLPAAPTDRELAAAKARAWDYHGVAWEHLEQVSRLELLEQAREGFPPAGGEPAQPQPQAAGLLRPR